MRPTHVPFLSLAFVLCLSTAAVPLLRAQSAGTGALTGTVSDPSGGVIPNVTVTMTSLDTAQVRSAATGSDGAYKFALLPPGSYRVRFTAMGFKTAEVPSVNVNVTETPVLDRVMEVGASSDQVTIDAQVETIQTASSTLGTVVGERAVVALPLTNRNYTQILSMSAGANVSVNNASSLGRGSQDVSVNGANVNQNNYQMDGVNVDNFAGNGLAGDAGIYAGIGIPNPDALQEFKIQTSTYDASYGRNPGANVNVVTRSGSNSIHGSLFEFFRNTALNANDCFRFRYCGSNAAVCAAGGGAKQVLNQNQFGGTVGMPLKRQAFLLFQLSGNQTGEWCRTQGYSSPTLGLFPAGDRTNTALQNALRAIVVSGEPSGRQQIHDEPGGRRTSRSPAMARISTLSQSNFCN